MTKEISSKVALPRDTAGTAEKEGLAMIAGPETKQSIFRVGADDEIEDDEKFPASGSASPANGDRNGIVSDRKDPSNTQADKQDPDRLLRDIYAQHGNSETQLQNSLSGAAARKPDVFELHNMRASTFSGHKIDGDINAKESEHSQQAHIFPSSAKVEQGVVHRHRPRLQGNSTAALHGRPFSSAVFLNQLSAADRETLDQQNQTNVTESSTKTPDLTAATYIRAASSSAVKPKGTNISFNFNGSIPAQASGLPNTDVFAWRKCDSSIGDTTQSAAAHKLPHNTSRDLRNSIFREPSDNAAQGQETRSARPMEVDEQHDDTDDDNDEYNNNNVQDEDRGGVRQDSLLRFLRSSLSRRPVRLMTRNLSLQSVPDYFNRPQHNQEGNNENGFRRSWRRWNEFLRKWTSKTPKQSREAASMIACMSAGAPAALLPAFAIAVMLNKPTTLISMPLFLDQVKINVRKTDESTSGPWLLELQYGEAGLGIQWECEREIWEFITLHSKLRSWRPTRQRQRHVKKPSFPLHAIPLFNRRVYGINESSKYSASSIVAGIGAIAGAVGGASSILRANESRDRMHRVSLEKYMQRLLQVYLHLPESLRICTFIELSPVGLMLKARGEPHIKEGFLNFSRYKFASRLFIFCSARSFRTHDAFCWTILSCSAIIFLQSPQSWHIIDVFLLDGEFHMHNRISERRVDEIAGKTAGAVVEAAAAPLKKHRIIIENMSRKIEIVAPNERTCLQFRAGLQLMAQRSPWCMPRKRYESFAPVRSGVDARWFVDAEDFYRSLHATLQTARTSVYIHDWWISPELYLERPPCEHEESRLDRVLQRVAERGVDIYILLYRNTDAAVPIDSSYTKRRLQMLHRNIRVLRSPSRFRQQQFFWAHHEKIVVIDESVAFIGGLDLCYGRFDTSEHSIVDDAPTWSEQTFPGKDYFNSRIADFSTLNEPFVDMFDRSTLPRMAWHDVHAKVDGHCARDVARHFVQRWNYVCRELEHSKPLILPPADTRIDFDKSKTTSKRSSGSQYVESEVRSGTCQVQVLRSCSGWSMGLTRGRECSIHTAYLDLIRNSEYFVYIENQFFITSTTFDGVKINNGIGDAIFERICRAHTENKPIKFIILMPLFPAFPLEMHEGSATSLRLIMSLQYYSISISENSLLQRLRARGIDPHEYINFFSLRTWGQFDKSQRLTTEVVYPHAKCMIVDDRVALIGSANINERSMRGSRDSEIALVIEDSLQINTKMYGKPFAAANFAHTLRVRLMQEHLGVSLDKMIMQFDLVNSSSLFSSTRDLLNGSSNSGGTDQETKNTKSLKASAYARFVDPVSKAFLHGEWMRSAVANTQIFRSVFRCIPDDQIQTWPQYYLRIEERARARAVMAASTASQSLRLQKSTSTLPQIYEKRNEVNPGAGSPATMDAAAVGIVEPGAGSAGSVVSATGTATGANPETDSVTNPAYSAHVGAVKELDHEDGSVHDRNRSETITEATASADEYLPRDSAYDALQQVSGHLVELPLHFMETEQKNGNFLTAIDRIPPIEIFD